MNTIQRCFLDESTFEFDVKILLQMRPQNEPRKRFWQTDAHQGHKGSIKADTRIIRSSDRICAKRIARKSSLAFF